MTRSTRKLFSQLIEIRRVLGPPFLHSLLSFNTYQRVSLGALLWLLTNTTLHPEYGRSMLGMTQVYSLSILRASFWHCVSQPWELEECAMHLPLGHLYTCLGRPPMQPRKKNDPSLPLGVDRHAASNRLELAHQPMHIYSKSKFHYVKWDWLL